MHTVDQLLSLITAAGTRIERERDVGKRALKRTVLARVRQSAIDRKYSQINREARANPVIAPGTEYRLHGDRLRAEQPRRSRLGDWRENMKLRGVPAMKRAAAMLRAKDFEGLERLVATTEITKQKGKEIGAQVRRFVRSKDWPALRALLAMEA